MGKKPIVFIEKNGTKTSRTFAVADSMFCFLSNHPRGRTNAKHRHYIVYSFPRNHTEIQTQYESTSTLESTSPDTTSSIIYLYIVGLATRSHITVLRSHETCSRRLVHDELRWGKVFTFLTSST